MNGSSSLISLIVRDNVNFEVKFALHMHRYSSYVCTPCLSIACFNKCQFNKFNVMNSKLIKNAFIENSVIKVRGDWTRPNKKIEQYLNSYNRFGIPFNVMYSKNYPKGIIFSELLTTSEIINTIELIQKN